MNELELLQKIKDLDKTITTNKLFTRKLNEDDWDTLVNWWRWWRWKPPVKSFLPENGTGGLMVEKNGVPIVAGFMYETNASVVLFEWIISNPKYKEKDRKQAVEKLINDAEKRTKELGVKFMFSIGRNKHLIKTHKNLGWFVDDKPSHEMLKNL